MLQISHPSCVYGNPCFSVCTNSKCKNIGLICKHGYETKQQCFLFHQQCTQIKWSQLQKIVNQNYSNANQQFLSFCLHIEQIFIKAIQKIKDQQQNFRMWVKTFGHSHQTPKLIKLMNSENFDQINGKLVSHVLQSYFENQISMLNPPSVDQHHLKKIQNQIKESISSLTSLYLDSDDKKSMNFLLQENKHQSAQSRLVLTKSQVLSCTKSDLSRSQLSQQQANEFIQSQIKSTDLRNSQKQNLQLFKLDNFIISQKNLQKNLLKKNILEKYLELNKEIMQNLNGQIHREIKTTKETICL